MTSIKKQINTKSQIPKHVYTFGRRFNQKLSLTIKLEQKHNLTRKIWNLVFEIYLSFVFCYL